MGLNALPAGTIGLILRCAGILAVLPLTYGGSPSPSMPVVSQDFDLIIANGRLVDGTGNPWRIADVGVRGDTIVAIGDLSQQQAIKTIDASGLVVAPGFIDTHTHCDGALVRPGPNANLNYLTQGVTTVVTGNCGSGTFRIAEFGDALERVGIGTNVVHLIGFGDVRQEVLEMRSRAPTTAEL